MRSFEHQRIVEYLGEERKQTRRLIRTNLLIVLTQRTLCHVVIRERSSKRARTC
jgi:hypothetical protein